MRVERQVLFWLGAAIVLALLVGLLEPNLLPFVAGVVIAYFLNPAADRLTSWGIPRPIASVLFVAAFECAIIAALVLVVPLALTQAQQLAVTMPEEIARARSLFEGWAPERLGSHYPEFEAGLERLTQAISDNWASVAGSLASSLWSQGLALLNFASLMLVTPLVVFYVLMDWRGMLAKIDSWLPREHATTLRQLASDINDAVSAFIRGQGTVCFVLAIYYSVALTAAGLRYSPLVGLGTGLMSFVTFVGFAGAQVLDSGFLSPNTVGQKIGLHPVWLIFSLFAFSYLFGFVGVLVAVRIAAAIGVVVRFGPILRAISTAGAPRAPPPPPP
jgi:predicted PurR-regulated permease PerM